MNTAYTLRQVHALITGHALVLQLLNAVANSIWQ